MERLGYLAKSWLEPYSGCEMEVQKSPKKQTAENPVEKKLRLSLGLFEAAFEIKKFQLRQKHPEKSERELNHMTYALFEKGAK